MGRKLILRGWSNSPTRTEADVVNGGMVVGRTAGWKCLHSMAVVARRGSRDAKDKPGRGSSTWMHFPCRVVEVRSARPMYRRPPLEIDGTRCFALHTRC